MKFKEFMRDRALNELQNKIFDLIKRARYGELDMHLPVGPKQIPDLIDMLEFGYTNLKFTQKGPYFKGVLPDGAVSIIFRTKSDNTAEVIVTNVE